MNGRFDEIIESDLEKKADLRKRKVMLSVICILLALVVLYLTMFPAQTMTPQPVCGLEAHLHNDECCEKKLVCTIPETEGHTHTEECVEHQTQLICTTEEGEEHTHTEECYEEIDVLVCAKDECEPHIHEAACYETHVICGKVEHEHSDACYEITNEDGNSERIYKDGELVVRTVLPKNSGIPADAQLSVTPVTEQTDAERFTELYDAASGNIGEDRVISDILFYDICFLLDGVEVEPQTGFVRVTIEFCDPAFDKPDIERATSLKVLHFDDENNINDVTDIVNVSSDGVASIEFSTDSFSVYAIALEDTVVTGSYYQRVTSIDDTNATYIIASVQGNYALTTQGSNYATRVNITPVKGNTGYYTITNSSGANAATISNMNWYFNTASGASGSSRIQVSATTRLQLNNQTIVGSNNTSPTVRYDTLTKCWTIVYNNYYLYMANSGTFSRSNSTSNTHFRHLNIFKRVDTTLTIPGDVIEDPNAGGGAEEPEKPEYADYISPSGAVTETYSASARVDVTATSDPSTSDIENQYAGVKADDGKVITDKSVVYGTDDYGAYTTYNDGVFSVTLSAMAQEYNIPYPIDEKTPVDVVLVLDCSGSMTSSNTSEGISRAQAMVNSVNTVMNKIFMTNPNNRVGIVTFSSGWWDFLEIDRYYVGSTGATIDYSTGGYTYLSFSNDVMSTVSNLRSATTRQTVSASVSGTWWGTFTQSGIALGGAMFDRVTNTTYTTPSGKTIARTPIYIMLSDGDPTHCTSNYADPISGPYYGSGVAEFVSNDNNNQGIIGYYTILTANYFKRMTAIHYGTVCKFYTIGLGISETGITDSSGLSATGDHYKRAVLNPNAANVNALYSNTSAQNYSTTALQLYQLLNGTFSGTSVTISTTTHEGVIVEMGTQNTVVPVLANPYAGDYDYADDAFFGSFTLSELEDIFVNIIDLETGVYNYGFILRQETSVLMYDYIGSGMEIKSTPVLRYNGVNYASTSQSTSTENGITTISYVYAYNVSDPYFDHDVDLSGITVKVSTDSAGLQTVEYFVPDRIVPLYSPESLGGFYFEQLPARLMYQVGIKDASLAAAADGDVFYTNRWQNNVAAMATMLPTDENPYYSDADYTDVTVNKASNPTATAATSFVTAFSNDTLTHTLGNNGKLVISKPTKMDITVNKQWKQPDGTNITDTTTLATMPSISLSLYRSTDPAQRGSLVQRVTVANTDGWTYTWHDLDRYYDDNTNYYYTVEETAMEGYETVYDSANTGLFGNNTLNISNRETFLRISVEKLWFDSLGQQVSANALDSMPAVNVHLYKTTDQDGGIGTAVGTATLNQSNQWTYTWRNLQPMDGEGNSYYYYAVEDNIEGYTPTYSPDIDGESGTITISNYPVSSGSGTSGSITVEKEWHEYGGSLYQVTDNMPPVTVNLYKRTGYIEGVTVTATFGNTTRQTTVPYGSSITYTVSATYSNSWNSYYASITANGTTISTSRSGSSRTGTYTLSGVTSDMTLRFATGYSTRSTSITVSHVSTPTITENTAPVNWSDTSEFVEEITLSTRNNWEYTWGNLVSAETDETTGRVYFYNYYLVENAVQGFTTAYSSNNIITPANGLYGIKDGTIVVTNTNSSPVAQLPLTGGVGNYPFIIMGILMMAISGGLLINKKRKDERRRT